ncbi:hypothetical protein [Hymenobacter sp. B81]|uniref:hypothetical protein n=1 Tax=Hymenobacter sp. B81 TaxID=3344878 RepID=UPI0037DCA453
MSRKLDLNAGIGTGFSGNKFGLGTRYFVVPEHRISPYFGLNVVYSPGQRDISVDNNNTRLSSRPIGTLDVRPTTVVHLRSGLRWQPGKQPGRVGVLGTIGYGIRTSKPFRYTIYEGYEEPNSSTKLANRILFLPGGLELSMGLSIGLGQKMRE